MIPLVATYLATDIRTGSILSDASAVFNKGIIVNISIALPIAYIIRALFIVPKMVYFANCLTLAELMGIYGRFARIITNILSALNAIIHTSIQLTALGIISGEPLLGIPSDFFPFYYFLLFTIPKYHYGTSYQRKYHTGYTYATFTYFFYGIDRLLNHDMGYSIKCYTGMVVIYGSFWTYTMEHVYEIILSSWLSSHYIFNYWVDYFL